MFEQLVLRVFALLLLSIGLCQAAIPAQSAAEQAYSEDAVKAAYLHRFAAYVEWPPAAAEKAPFTIGVVGSDGLLEQLQRLLPAIHIGGRPASARAIQRASDLDDVAILYIARGRLAAAKPLIAAAAARTVLIVTDEPAGLADGSMINFVRVGKNMRFEVSQPAADRAGIKIDPALLAVAVRVEVR